MNDNYNIIIFHSCRCTHLTSEVHIVLLQLSLCNLKPFFIDFPLFASPHVRSNYEISITFFYRHYIDIYLNRLACEMFVLLLFYSIFNWYTKACQGFARDVIIIFSHDKCGENKYSLHLTF